MEDEMVEELQQLEQSFDKAFGKAEELNAVFKKSEKPRQRIIVEILVRTAGSRPVNNHSCPQMVKWRRWLRLSRLRG
jgi:hypothetical protein